MSTTLLTQQLTSLDLELATLTAALTPGQYITQRQTLLASGDSAGLAAFDQERAALRQRRKALEQRRQTLQEQIATQHSLPREREPKLPVPAVAVVAPVAPQEHGTARVPLARALPNILPTEAMEKRRQDLETIRRSVRR